MKSAIIIPVLFCGVLCINNHVSQVVQNEVLELMALDSSLTVDGCTQQCDDIFRLDHASDEERIDHICHSVCLNQLEPHSTHAPHHHHHPTTVTMPPLSTVV